MLTVYVLTELISLVVDDDATGCSLCRSDNAFVVGILEDVLEFSIRSNCDKKGTATPP